MTRGSYQLTLHLQKATVLQVGKAGDVPFSSRTIVYTGSALNGVEGRLARHRRQNKKMH